MICMVVKAKHKNYDRDSIKKLYQKENKARLKIRLLAIKLSYEGKYVQDIADILSKSRQTVANWIILFNDYGIEGIYDSDKVGRPVKIDEDVEEMVKKNQ